MSYERILNRSAAWSCGLALVCSWPAVALGFPPEGARETTLDVIVDPTIVDSNDLRVWVDDEGRKVLRDLPNRDRRGSLRVEIAGSTYDYEITLTALREDGPVGEPEVWQCECSNEDLLEQVRSALPNAAERLVVTGHPVVPKPITTVEPPPDDGEDQQPDPPPTRRPLGRIGGAGVALLTTGLVGVAGGVVFAALGEDRERGNTRGGDVEVHNYWSPGTAAIAGGAGLALTGLVMILLRGRNQTKRIELGSVAPRIDGSFGLAMSGRF